MSRSLLSTAQPVVEIDNQAVEETDGMGRATSKANEEAAERKP